MLNLFLSLPGKILINKFLCSLYVVFFSENSTIGGFSDSDDGGLINNNVTSAVHCIKHGDEVLQQYGFHKVIS